MTADWILPQSLEVVMGHQELSRLWRQAWTETGPQEKPWVRRRARKDQKKGERSSHYPADTAGSLSAMGGAGSNCQTGTSLNSACCSLGLVTATCSTTGALHPEWSWAGSSDLGQIVGSSARGASCQNSSLLFLNSHGRSSVAHLLMLCYSPR